ncbi:MAG TPA: cytochrome c [Stellaceae bacterium]|nr:cytochrome c [Stellaceae bacterium]
MRRTWLKSWILLLTCILAALSALATTPALTEADYRYLKAEFGLGVDSFTLRNISAEDGTSLHRIINRRPASWGNRDLNVASYLFDVELRTCQAWELTHGKQPCPMVDDPSAIPGWEVAELRCVACHLTGTTTAPSFFKMTKSRPIDEQQVATALRGVHEMAPMTLSPEEVQALVRYINSLR